MSKFTNPAYLQTDQYRNADNLNARIAIHERFSTNPQGWFPWVWDILSELPAQADVLELGCGSGAIWTACPERVPPRMARNPERLLRRNAGFSLAQPRHPRARIQIRANRRPGHPLPG
jgi:hypothetical protein